MRRLYPFLIVFGLELAFILYLIFTHRGMIGHDGFQYFGLQYYFLNNAAATGETAQWMPFLTHGTIGNWWYGVQAGILQSAMLALGKLNAVFMGANFLPIFYLGILFDLTLFLTGVCLLGRRYFNSRLTILFVAVLSLGSATWFTQPWHNLHFYFALPLILHFIHALLETGRWRYLLLAGNLFVVQAYGTLPYFLPVASLVVCLYTLFHVVFFWQEAKPQIIRLCTENLKYAVIPVALVLLSLGLVYGMLTHGVEEIANYNVVRTAEGRNESLDAFMRYGANRNTRWAELLTRFSPALDYSIYIGYLGVAFAALAFLKRPSRALLVVACTTLIVLLIANGTSIAEWAYFYWPMMRYFRHLSLASTIVRMLLCLIAGFGFEAFLRSLSTRGAVDRVRYASLTVLLAGTAAILFLSSHSSETSIWLTKEIVRGTLPLDLKANEGAYVQRELWIASIWCAGAALLFAISDSRRISKIWLATAFVVFQALDIYSFKYGLAGIRTIPLTAAQYEVSKLQPVPYSRRRTPIDYNSHPRARLVPQKTYEAVYWTSDTFTFTDPPSNIGRTDHWLRSVDDFLRTFWGQDLRILSRRLYSSFLPFPFHQPGAAKLAGVTEDKIQFFAGAQAEADDARIRQLLASPSFDGDRLYVSAAKLPTENGTVQPGRVHRAYEIIQYDANNIRIRVPGANRGEWLYYADAWHPFWRARVNGESVPLYKANLGYKAVPLEAGENVVHLRCHSSVMGIYLQALNWNGLAWVLILGYLLYRTARRQAAMDADPRPL